MDKLKGRATFYLSSRLKKKVNLLKLEKSSSF